MKVLIADKFQQKYLGDLESLGYEITLNPDLNADDIVWAIADEQSDSLGG